MNTDKQKKRPFGIRDSISYAAGDFGCSMSFALKGTLAIFWTQYMRLDLWYALLLVIVQIWDAVNDPIIGTVIDMDRRSYRRGKFLAYIWFGSIGLLIAGALCFLPVPNAPIWAQVLIFVAGYVIWDAFYTIANVPYGSLLSLISDNAADRASLSAWRSIGATIGNMLPMAILPFLIYDNEENLIGERVFFAALLMGAFGLVAFQYMVRTTEIRVENEVRLHADMPKFQLRTAFSNFLNNRPALGTTLAAMGMFLGLQGATTAVTVLFQSYFQNVAVLGLVQVFSMLPVIAFTPFARKMVARYGKKEIATVGALVSIVSCVALFVLPMPPNSVGVFVYLLCQLANSLGFGIFSTVSWAMMGDAIDYNFWRHGRREEGVIYSMHSFFRKLAQGLGPSLVLVLMYALGYVGENGGSQKMEVAVHMRYLVAALYLAGAILLYLGVGLVYNLNKNKLAEMHQAIGMHTEES